MVKKVLAVTLALLMVFTYMPAVLASGGDTTPPKLVDVQMNKTAYTVGDTMTITLQIDEKESGLKLNVCRIEFSTLDGSSWNFQWIDGLKKGSQPGTYIAEQKLTKDSGPAGDYKISRISMEDNSGNTSSSSCSYVVLPADAQFQFSFANTERTDWTGPALKSVDVSPSNATVGDSVTVSITADDASGLADEPCQALISDADYHYFAIDLHRDAGNSSKFTGTTVIPELPSGDYYVIQMLLCDSVGNGTLYSDSALPIPQEFRKKIAINNPNKPVVYDDPVITAIDISPKTIKQGDYFDITVTLDTKGNPLLGDSAISGVHNDNDVGINYGGFSYVKVSDGVYKAHVSFPVNWPAGNSYISGFVVNLTNGQGLRLHWSEPGHDINGVFIDSKGQYTQKITTTPVFSGTDNVSVLKGSTFDPMAGVSAANTTEGDMTSKIAVETPDGFNTDTVGVYLFKYTIKSSQTDSDGNPRYYYDFRWVGVTEVMPVASGTGSTPLVITNDAVKIGADSKDAALSKDGKKVTLTSTVSKPGSYTLSAKSAGASASSALSRAYASKTTTSAKSNASFIIDRTGPALSVTQSGVWPGKVNLQVKAKDQSGLSVLKWSKGSCTLASVRKAGTVFSAAFTATSFGKYTIYAKDVLGNESLTVVDVKHVAVASIKISNKSIKVAAGCTFALTASLQPTNATYKQVTWSSSNTAIATVDSNGKVHGIKPGTAKITVRSTDGSKTKTCVVTVTKPVSVSAVKLNKYTKSLAVGGTFTLVAAVYPANASVRGVTWSSSNAAIVTVDSAGKIKALKKGSVYIYAKAKNGKYARCLVTVK